MNLKQHVGFPSHICGHTLDLGLSKQFEPIVNALVSDRLLSDRFAIMCSLTFTKPSFSLKYVLSKD